jgi:hypothetical protein
VIDCVDSAVATFIFPESGIKNIDTIMKVNAVPNIVADVELLGESIKDSAKSKVINNSIQKEPTKNFNIF